VWTLTRVSWRYWRQSVLLIVAVLLPSVANLAHERLVRLDEQRRWLLGRVVWAQEEERRRIAGEVHDDAIQTIAAARLILTTFRDQLTDDRQRRLLDHLEEAVSSACAGSGPWSSTCARPSWTTTSWPPPRAST